MLESGLKIIDRIIQLLELKEKNKRALHDDHVEPIFASMELVHTDYLIAIEDLIKQSESTESTEDFIECIRKYKLPLEGLREKIFIYSHKAKSQRNLPVEAEHFFDSCINYFSDFKAEDDNYSYVGLFSGLLMHHDRKIDIDIDLYLRQRYEIGEDGELTRIKVEENILVVMQNQLRKNWKELVDKYSSCRLQSL